MSFTDQSSDSPTSWSWTFGDGGTSTRPEPEPHLHRGRHLHGHPDGDQRLRLGRRDQDRLHHRHRSRATSTPRCPSARASRAARWTILDHRPRATTGRIQVTTANTPHSGSYHLTMDCSQQRHLQHQRGLAAPEPRRRGPGRPELLVEGLQRRDAQPGRRVLLGQRRRQLREGPGPERRQLHQQRLARVQPGRGRPGRRPTA